MRPKPAAAWYGRFWISASLLVVCMVALWLRISGAFAHRATSPQHLAPIVVRADAEPLWGSSIPLQLRASIGRLDGPPEYTIGDILFLAGTRAGDVFSFDAQDMQIRHYDARGHFIGLVGRHGSGPGEYRRISGMSIIGDSLLVVCDPSNGRLLLFGIDGEPRGTFSVPGTFHERNDCAVDDDGLVYRWAELPPKVNGCPSKQNRGRGWAYIRLGPGMIPVDTIRVSESCRRDPVFVAETSDGARSSFAAESVSFAYGLGGIVEGFTDEYRFAIRASTQPLIIVERSTRRVRLGSEEFDEWTALSARLSARRPGSTSFKIPRTKPVFRSLSSDGSGRVWVHLYVDAEKRSTARSEVTSGRLLWKERNVYDVFSKEWRYLGRVVLPPEAQLLAIAADLLFVVVKGAQGEDLVRVFEMKPNG